MSQHFLHNWDFSHTVIRDEELERDLDYSSHTGSFGDDSVSWMWQGDDAFESGNQGGGSSLMYDFLGGSSFKLNHSEPVSPSSVATTPTTSEHPVSVSISPPRHEQYSALSVQPTKRQRKSAVDRSAIIDRNGRKKKYDAPPGVWRNSGGFISTVYINKKRVYGPLRRDVADAVRDREEMSLAKTVINTEEGMRAFVQGMKERCGINRTSVSIAEAATTISNSSCSPVRIPTIPSTVRVSSRPVRAAAKRNLYVPSEQDDDEDDGTTVTMDAQFEDHNSFDSTSFAFM